MFKNFALTVSTLALGVVSASASLTFDLRVASVAASVGVRTDAKNVTIQPGATGNIAVEIWGNVTTLSSGNSIWGLSSVRGSIVSSTSGGTGVAGTIGAAVPTAPFGESAPAGGTTGNEFSSVADLLKDLGTSSTSAVTNTIKLSKLTTGGGTSVAGTFMATNVDNPVISTNEPITLNGENGFRFLLGTVTIAVTGATSGTTSVNWFINGLTGSAAVKGQIATWTQADGLAATGNTQTASMFVGAPINLAVIPEPSVAVTLLGGVTTLLGLRRRKR